MKSLILAALVAASPAVAQDCIPTVDAYLSLSQNFGEERLVVTVLPDGRVLELWVNPETETWSMMLTLPEGMSCGVGSGVGYIVNKPEPNV